ncbi:MAG: alpha/beta hydrolase domain-containing protein, partial [Vicinamibacterales bacterium]
MDMSSDRVRVLVVTAVLAVAGAWTVLAQAPLPLPGQPAPVQGGRGGRAGGPAPPDNLPSAPVVAPLATISPEVTGPGEMFSSLMALPAGDDLARFRYQTHEYFVSGTANGQPYRTRLVIRMPSDRSQFSGVVLAESMHPSGNAWMFHFTHTYTMSSGHIGVEIVTSTPAQFTAFNQARYADMTIGQGQA